MNSNTFGPKGNVDGLGKQRLAEHSLADRLAVCQRDIEELRSEVRGLRAERAEVGGQRPVVRGANGLRILEAVAVHCRVTTAGIRGRGRAEQMVWPRHLCVLLLSELLDWNRDEIADFLHHDYSFVAPAIGSAESRIRTYSLYRRDYETLKRILGGDQGQPQQKGTNGEELKTQHTVSRAAGNFTHGDLLLPSRALPQ